MATKQRIQALQNRHFGSKTKMQKNMLKKFLQDIAAVLCNKLLQKTANIRKMRAF